MVLEQLKIIFSKCFLEENKYVKEKNDASLYSWQHRNFFWFLFRRFWWRNSNEESSDEEHFNEEN